MAKTAVHMRLDATLLAGADRYAQQREWSRTQVVEKALASFLEDVRGGVPEVPKPAGVSRAVERQATVRSVGRAEDGMGGPSFRDGSVGPSRFTSKEAWQRWAARRAIWMEENDG